MDSFEAANRRALAEDMNDEIITNIMIRSIGYPVPYDESSIYYRIDAARDGMPIPQRLFVGWEPLHWRVMEQMFRKSLEAALKRAFSANVDGPPDPATFTALHRKFKQAAYKRMFTHDIINDNLPWKSSTRWKWWRTREGREGRKVVRRKLKFWLWEYGLNWLAAKRADHHWLLLLLPQIFRHGSGPIARMFWRHSHSKKNA
ncbi:hypothetical protein FKW77_006030 [Venturia effusa]|uniref:Uncharacterized protein n=1 Tax=Venturia effusa TaxID=50376 RepID=A0A517LQA2_9PEZI|nr:hypothetical protein FKW77_006030 [Venturia effusa]